ncbi:MAG: four helix bundle protein [Candidatus Peribacteraceae bacterium]|jgi:four helix bundle protein|nr:four helix bundle protein [Candidatus Peribacteraceae bacterium]
MEHFTQLEAWKNGLELVREIYAITRLLPREELYGIVSQLRRASTSILANIAEGFGRFTYPDKAAKYTIARGESSEVEAFLLIIVSLSFVAGEKIKSAIYLVERERRLLSGLITACHSRS